MGILNCNHPEVIDFIRAKLVGELSNFNISVMLSDNFMEKVENGGKVDLVHGAKKFGSVKARDILDLVSFCSWCCGDPGVLFLDRINRDNPFRDRFVIDTTNPCSEVALPAYGACCLGSLNLSKYVSKNKFEFEKFERDCWAAVRMLRNMNYLSWYPLPQIAETMREFFPIGVGVMGFADVLIKLGIRYDSEECVSFVKDLGIAYKAGTEEIGKGCFYKRVIAPTGSLSILAGCSSGIEPVFAPVVERTLSPDLGVLVEEKELYRSEFARFAHQVSPEWHLRVQAAWQEQVDGGVSKTINMPYETGVDQVKQIYLDAWKAGVKGVTVFRSGCKEGTLRELKCDGESCQL